MEVHLLGTVATAFSDNGVAQFELDADTGWDQDADGVNFGGSGTYTATSWWWNKLCL